MKDRCRRKMKCVAPLAGAWIEIQGSSTVFINGKSLPSRERGLKYALYEVNKPSAYVAPLAGAWIEINIPIVCLRWIERRSPRGSVD